MVEEHTATTGCEVELLLIVNLIDCQLAPNVESPAARTTQFLFLLRPSSVYRWWHISSAGSARTDVVIEQKGKPEKKHFPSAREESPRARRSFHNLLL